MTAPTAATSRTRRLPSADWIAFSIAIAAIAARPFAPLAGFLVLPAVFLPSLLRELGLLRDADELTLAITRRAGFHAVLMAVLLLWLNRLLPALDWYAPAATVTGSVPFRADRLLQTVTLMFVVSYVLQYWGARQASVRILLAMALLKLLDVAPPLLRGHEAAGRQVLISICLSALFAGLALVARRWPRAGGGAVLLLGGLLLAPVIGHVGNTELGWAVVATLVNFALVFGGTGVALLRATSPEGS